MHGLASDKPPGYSATDAQGFTIKKSHHFQDGLDSDARS